MYENRNNMRQINTCKHKKNKERPMYVVHPKLGATSTKLSRHVTFIFIQRVTICNNNVAVLSFNILIALSPREHL